MKHFLFLYLLFIYNSVFCQNEELQQASKNIDKIINFKENEKLAKIYVTDIETIDTLIRKSSKKYKIVYNFSHKCHASVELLPKILIYLRQHPKDFDFFPVIGHRYEEIVEIKKYLIGQTYTGPIFILDVEKYGNKKNPFNRLDKLQKICKECNYKKMGFSSFFIMDNNKKIIASTTWDNTSEEMYEMITKLALN